MDLKGQRLIEADTYFSSPCSISHIHNLELAPIEQASNKFKKIRLNFPDLLKPTLSTAAVKHGVQHHIITTGPPISSRDRRLAPHKLANANKELLEMESMGIVRKSNSPWALPLHMVEKSDGGWRPAEITVVLMMQQPLIDTQFLTFMISFHSWLGKQFFSKIDLVRGYHQIPMQMTYPKLP
ncbi:Pol polyprotein [Elysia marginata]|uniref:Pol polyprotein n=1 Tax=Elysia marginata TaxID=1093978 RepID=A0AAV4GF72_9GAST|nr:Pol polyprotein [Elysia marginata]